MAAAIVTSHLDVLVGRRRDGAPPWTFPAGKIEAGESPEDAAVRETWEETGLQVRATGVIGSRIHPASAVPIVYVEATPASEADARIRHAGSDFEARDDHDLTEVRWVSIAEAGELMGDMSGLVREYLRGTLG